ncbi:MAG: T9SS type A sorting domain-containing protein [Chlorobi bacterium]|nr:T9SS type A sorting domain-containing protein [Chlorobiota bacterium]
MKKITILIGMILISCAGYSQTTSIPDPIFEQYLIDNGIDTDGTLNGHVATADIIGVTHISVSDMNINSLEGIQDFTSLTDLSCARNNLTSITLPDVTGLATFNIAGNNLTTINFPPSFTQLLEFSCADNQITSINFNNITYINWFDCPNNLFTSLDLSAIDVEGLQCTGNPLLESIDFRNGQDMSQVYQFDATNNPNLTCIYVDDASDANLTNWSINHAVTNFVEDSAGCTLAQTGTYVPDDNFEAYLEANGMGNGTPNDNWVLTANIETVTDLDVSNKSIADLTGIQDFAALTTLDCSGNALTALDLSSNLNLNTTLNASGNQLTSIQLPNNAGLGVFNISHNNLTGLNFPATYTTLLTFDCTYNSLAYILFNNITYINAMDCSNNLLIDLDFTTVNVEGLTCSNNPIINKIYLKNGHNKTDMYQFIAHNDPLLTCIFVDDPAWSTTNWTQIDDTAHFVADNAGCQYYKDHTYVPDDNFEQALIDQGYDDVLDNYVLTSDINYIGFLDVSGKNISSLEGIQGFMELSTLVCSNNNLTYLDISKNHILEFGCDNNQLTTLILNVEVGVVDCSNNQLSSLDIPTGIENLNCSHNAFTSLDLSNTNYLSILDCSNNQLTTLDLRNGQNNQIVYDYDFDARNNPDLTCIYVDDVAYRNTNWPNIDGGTHFVLDEAACSQTATTYVPDDNFEAYLEANGMGNGIANDNYVDTGNISGVTSLLIYNKNIADLTGIEDFTALQVLNCNGNTLTSLNVTQNLALKELYANTMTGITTLDVSHNTELEVLSVEDTHLNAIDVSTNTKLLTLTLANNNLTGNLDLTNNPLLEYFHCENNALTGLNISNKPALTTIYCSNNQIANLNLSGDTALSELHCGNNGFTTLDLSSNIALTKVFCNNSVSLNSIDLRNGHNAIITDFDTTSSAALSCIFVDDVTYSTSNWTHIDPTTHFVPDEATCNSYTQVYVPDDNFEAYLEANAMGNGIANDNYASKAYIELQTDLDVSNKGITDLTGIEAFTNLQSLVCSNNSLTSLDLTALTSLQNLHCDNNQLTGLIYPPNVTELDCNHNQLTSLIVSDQMFSLDCSYNLLTALDVSANTYISHVFCNNNQLTSLDMRNGGNTFLYSFDFDATSNPNLTCVFVDDPAWSDSNWASSVDATASFVASEADCGSTQMTYVPDNNFEQLLIDLGYDSGALDDFVITSHINTIVTLDLGNRDIVDFTGIEDFVMLETIYCRNNDPVHLDLGALGGLIHIYVSGNPRLSSIVLPGAFGKKGTANKSNGGANTTLLTVDLHGNALTSLDLSNYTQLTTIKVNDNNLTSLNVQNGNNSNIDAANFDASGNSNLADIVVDDASYAAANWPNVDPASTFTTDSTLGVEDIILSSKISIYPNPAKDNIKIIAPSTVINKIEIYNFLGIPVKIYHKQNQYSIVNLPAGMYLIKIDTDDGIAVKKLIIK